METLENALSSLEKFSPYIIDAYLRGMGWEESFDYFFRLHSPKFAKDDNSSPQNMGGGLDLQLKVSHNEFLNSMENLLEIQLDNIGISQSKFVTATESGLFILDPVPQSLLVQLSRLEDFNSFGEMMEDRFNKIYHSEVSTLSSHNVVENSKMKEAEEKFSLDFIPSHIAVRVLWDIENIQVSKQRGGLGTMSQLMQFLRRQGLMGEGIDCRFSAFFNPAGRAVSKSVVKELDQAAVEMIWVSGKREDADRKLGNRIMQEMQVLPVSSTVFVILSSDLDFRHHYQLLSNRGYKIVLIHRSGNSSGNGNSNSSAIKMEAKYQDDIEDNDDKRSDHIVETKTECRFPSLTFEKSPAISKRYNEVATSPAEISTATVPTKMMTMQIWDRKQSSTPIANKATDSIESHKYNDSRKKSPLLDTTPETLLLVQEEGSVQHLTWFEANCSRWVTSRGFGFVTLTPSSLLQASSRVPGFTGHPDTVIFVHFTSIRFSNDEETVSKYKTHSTSTTARFLVPGESILIQIGLREARPAGKTSKKQPENEMLKFMAINVKATCPPLRCEIRNTII